MLEILKDDGWKMAFQCAGEISMENSQYNDANVIPALPNSGVSLISFSREDVAEIYIIEEGENDTSDWICFGQLKDRRYFFLSARYDYTDWNCRSSGYATVSDDKKELIEFGIDDGVKERLKIK